MGKSSAPAQMPRPTGGAWSAPATSGPSSGSATASRPSRKWGSWSRTSTSGSVTFLFNTTTGSSTSAGSWANRKSASGTKSKTGTRDASPSKRSTRTKGDLRHHRDRKSTRLNSSHGYISYAVFCLKKKTRAEEHRERGDQQAGGAVDRSFQGAEHEPA